MHASKTEERIRFLEERMNILLLEMSKLKLILEDICFEANKESNLKSKTRRKS